MIVLLLQINIKKLNGTTVDGYERGYKSFVLASGASVRPVIFFPAGERLLSIGVDINGSKDPNMQGRDLFWIYIYNNGMRDDYGTSAPMTEEEREDIYNRACLSNGAGAGGCFGKILNDNWEMTY